MIGADVGGEADVVLRADFRDAVAGADVENNRLAGVSTAAAGGEQQLPVAAEFQDVGLAFRIRQHARHVQRRRFIEDDLLVADTASSGAQGLVASTVTELARGVMISGSTGSFSGIGGGPAGHWFDTSTFATMLFFFGPALLPAFSSAPLRSIS